MPHLAPAILHADDALIVTVKPAGLLSMPARGEDRQDSLEGRIQALYADARLVHRLDMATSGLVLFARGPEMLRRLNLAFEQRVIGKQYCALVHGHLATDSGEIALPSPPTRATTRASGWTWRPAAAPSPAGGCSPAAARARRRSPGSS
jgi:tRNA pseudouridine32 synthase/23S rRNA pseudouridine746 synthase